MCEICYNTDRLKVSSFGQFKKGDVRMKKSKSGFTLVEILIILAIIGLLLAIAVPSFRKAHEEALKAKTTPVLTTAEQEEQAAINERLAMERNLAQIKDFGNGVYYFPFVDDEFRKIISTFLSSHTNLEVVASDGDVVKFGGWDSGYGATSGHTVFFREKH